MCRPIMFVWLFFVVMSLIAVSADADEFRRLPVSEYVDKMKAGWIGQMVGAGLGRPTEYRFMDEITPEERLPRWSSEMVNQFDYHDLYVEMTFLRTLEEHGLDVSARQAGIDFANTGYLMRRGNNTSRNNLRAGIAPPDSGHPKFGGHSDDIDYTTAGDFAGLISPGMPNQVIGLGEVFGRITGYDGGLCGGLFVSGMYAEAFFETDIEKIIHAGLKCIPEDSQYYKCISDVLKWNKEEPENWRETWGRVDRKYDHNPDSPPFSASKDRIIAKVYGAYMVMGLLYGNGDLQNTIAIAMQCGSGQDADFTASNAAGVLFTTKGLSKLPSILMSALDDEANFNRSKYNFPRLAVVCEKLARKNVLKIGGRIETDEDGNDVFVIPVRDIKTGKAEDCFKPGPIANSKYTTEELKKINPAPAQSKDTNHDDAIEKFAPGWSISGCADDMVTGLYGKRLGRPNVLVTHPLTRDSSCVISKRVQISSGKKTALRLEVGHHLQGDWMLVVKANGEIIFKRAVGPENTVDTWLEAAVDLSSYAGEEIYLELLNQPSGWAWEGAYWAKVRIESD